MGVVLLAGCTPAGKTVSRSVIENRIQTILEVPTIEFVYREVLYIGEEARFLGIKHLDKRLLFSVDIILKAGFDLSKGIEIDRAIDNTIRIILPEPEILEVDADEDSIHQFFVKEWGGRITRMDYYDELNRRKNDIKKDAVSRGILLKAKENGEKMISGLLQSIGDSKVRILYKTGEALHE